METVNVNGLMKKYLLFFINPLTQAEHVMIMLGLAPVAQLDRVPGYEPGGRRFESFRARQNTEKPP